MTRIIRVELCDECPHAADMRLEVYDDRHGRNDSRGVDQNA